MDTSWTPPALCAEKHAIPCCSEFWYCPSTRAAISKYAATGIVNLIHSVELPLGDHDRQEVVAAASRATFLDKVPGFADDVFTFTEGCCFRPQLPVFIDGLHVGGPLRGKVRAGCAAVHLYTD